MPTAHTHNTYKKTGSGHVINHGAATGQGGAADSLGLVI